MLCDWKFHLEKYDGRILGSHMWILVNKQQYSVQNESFGMMYKFL